VEKKMLQIRWPSKGNLWEDSDYEGGNTTKWRLQANALPQPRFNTLKAKAYANGIDMLCLPILWPFDLKTGELRRLSEAAPAEVAGPLKSLSEYVLRDLLTKTQVDHFCASNSKHGVKKCAVFEHSRHSAHFKLHFIEDQVSDQPSGDPMMLSAIHDFGIPEPCTDIMFLLIDDLLHMSEANVERYYRVWRNSGSAMLMSSTTVRSFNSVGYLDEVVHAMLL
jgi:hypothetical protein